MTYFAAAAAAITALAGTAISVNAQQSAAKRQRELIQQQQEVQSNLQQQGTQAALKQAQEFAPQTRIDKQQALEGEITSNLMQPVQQAQPGMQQQQKIQGNVSSDYLAGQAQSQADQMKNANALASILGKTMGASRLRTDESIDMGDTGNLIDRLHDYSQADQAASNIGVQQAGIPNGGAMLAGGLLQAAGSAAAGASAGGAWGAPTKPLAGSAGAGDAWLGSIG